MSKETERLLKASCGYCQAKPGQMCKTKQGNESTVIHVSRYRRARRRETQ